MPRAQYVYVEDRCLYAVFAKGVQPSELSGMVGHLDNLEVIATGATQKVLADGMSRTVLWVRASTEFAGLAGEVLKEQTDPYLPITVNSLNLRFVYCPCGHKSITGHTDFLNGFKPDNEATFEQQYIQALAGCDLFTLWETKPEPSSTEIVARVTKVFAELKAILQKMSIEGSANPELCDLKNTHQGL